MACGPNLAHLPVSVNKALLEQSIMHLYVIYGYFCARTTELSSYNGDDKYLLSIISAETSNSFCCFIE